MASLSPGRERRRSRIPAVNQPLMVEGGRIVARVVIAGTEMAATIDTGATRSFVGEDWANKWGTKGESVEERARIHLADGSALELSRALKLEVALAEEKVTLSVLIMPTMLEHVILGMDFLSIMGTTISCGQSKLELRVAESRQSDKSALAKKERMPIEVVPLSEEGSTARSRRRKMKSRPDPMSENLGEKDGPCTVT